VEYDSSNKLNIKALVLISGKIRKIPILEFINSLESEEYRKIIKSMNDITKLGYDCPEKLVRDRKKRKIYEIKPTHGKSRILCFPDNTNEILICSCSYRKSQGDFKAQSREFDNCFQWKRAYYKFIYDIIL
jgi:hypothetical protein